MMKKKGRNGLRTRRFPRDLRYPEHPLHKYGLYVFTIAATLLLFCLRLDALLRFPSAGSRRGHYLVLAFLLGAALFYTFRLVQAIRKHRGKK